MKKEHATLLVAVAIILVGAILFGTYLRFRPSDPQPDTATYPAGSAVPASADPSVVASGLDTPWSLVFLNDSTPLVSSRNTGEILEIMADGTQRTVGTVSDSVHAGEGGLLGLAIDEQSRLYAYFTTATDNRIARFAIEGQPGSLSLGRQETILAEIPRASNHNGGRIAFGPDGMLYVTTGDAGNKSSSQNRDSLAGKILRMTPDGQVPADNPFPDSLVYSYGHRNPQGLAWSEDGTMFATEFGQNRWDELNVIEPGGNYGWPEVEGVAQTEGYVDPVQQWSPSTASPSGMAYLNGTLFIANLRGGVLRTVPVSAPDTFTDRYAGQYGRLRDAVISPDGKLWLLTNNTDGRGRPGGDDDRVMAVSIEEAG